MKNKLYVNALVGKLANGVSADSTELIFQPISYTPLPTLNEGQWFTLTIQEDLNIEIVKVTGIEGNTLTVERGFENTIAREWEAEVSIGTRLTATDATYFNAKQDALTGEDVKDLYENNPDTNVFTDVEKAKLGGIAENATANATDAYLVDRSNHTGTQDISTVAGLQASLDDKATIALLEEEIGYIPKYFRGEFGSEADLETIENPKAGDYVLVDGLELTNPKILYYFDPTTSAWLPLATKDYVDNKPLLSGIISTDIWGQPKSLDMNADYGSSGYSVFSANASLDDIPQGSVILGYGAGGSTKDSLQGIAIGYTSRCTGAGTIAIGTGVNAGGESSIGIGGYCRSDGYNAVSIGYLSKALMESSIAIGDFSQVTEDYSIAIGGGSEATQSNSIALGYYSHTTKDYQLSVAELDQDTHLSDNPRIISGVAPGVVDQDAVNKKQLDDALGLLGSASKRDVGESSGNVMEVGAFGVGAGGRSTIVPVNTTPNETMLGGFYARDRNVDISDADVLNGKYPVKKAGCWATIPSGTGKSLTGYDGIFQLYGTYQNDLFFRAKYNDFLDWREVWHDGNLANASVSEIRAGTATTPRTLTAQVIKDTTAFQTVTGTSITLNLNTTSPNILIEPTANTTLNNPTNAKSGECGDIIIKMGATVRTVAFGNAWKFRGGSIPQALANSMLVISYKVISGTEIICSWENDIK